VDVKETKMKTQDIKNMGLALKQVQEKILTQKDKQKALDKARRTAKPKDQVSLKPMPPSLAKKMNQEAMSDDEKNFKPHMMYDPKTGKGYKADKYADHVRMNKMGYTHDDPKTKKKEEDVKEYSMVRAMKNHMKKMKKDEALKGDQHKLDHDKDGDIDGKDFAALRNKKKKGEKAEVKPRQEPDTEKGKGDAPMEKTESTRWPVYARIMEKATHKGGATPPEEMDSKDSPTAKKMKADHKPEVKDNPEASGDDVKKASDSAPAMKARSNDNMKGDKAIVNPVKGAVTK
tara:strand:+ start:542 stop:1405 length:864 start_codon:yes stop_codon:yes gene_type:complete